MWWSDTCIYCKMFTTIGLVNTSFISHNYHFVVVMVRTFKIYCFRTCKRNASGCFWDKRTQGSDFLAVGKEVWFGLRKNVLKKEKLVKLCASVE